MNDNNQSQTIAVWETNCVLCSEKLKAPTREEVRKALDEHIKVCSTAQKLREWSNEGILQDIVLIFRMSELDRQIKKLRIKYTFKQIHQALEDTEWELSH